MEFNIKLLFVITSMVLNFNAAAKEKNITACTL